VTTYASDSFTGADDAPWSTGTWAFANSTTGSLTFLAGNQGRMDAGSLTSYAGKCARVLVATSVVPARIRKRVTFRFTGDGAIRGYLRADSSLDDRTGYVFTMNRALQVVTVYRVVNYAVQPLGSVSYTIAQDVTHEVDFQAIGNQISLWVWLVGDAKPMTPTIQVTDGTITAPGSIGLVAIGGSAAWFKVDIEDFVASDGQGEITLTGSATATGTLLRQPRRIFSGSSTATGVRLGSKVILRTFTGSASATGTLLRARLRTLTGSATATGTLLRQPQRIMTGTASATGTLRRGLLRTLTGSATATGTLVPQFLGRIVGDSATVQMAARALSWVRITARKWTS
jgi:hypothetical protein